MNDGRLPFRRRIRQIANNIVNDNDVPTAVAVITVLAVAFSCMVIAAIFSDPARRIMAVGFAVVGAFYLWIRLVTRLLHRLAAEHRALKVLEKESNNG